MDARTKAIIAHFTPIGWLIAYMINSSNKEEFASFHLRQTMGIYLVWFLTSFVPVVHWIFGIVIFAFWLLSIVYALKGQRKVIPFGNYFQDWFRSL